MPSVTIPDRSQPSHWTRSDSEISDLRFWIQIWEKQRGFRVVHSVWWTADIDLPALEASYKVSHQSTRIKYQSTCNSGVNLISTITDRIHLHGIRTKLFDVLFDVICEVTSNLEFLQEVIMQLFRCEKETHFIFTDWSCPPGLDGALSSHILVSKSRIWHFDLVRGSTTSFFKWTTTVPSDF